MDDITPINIPIRLERWTSRDYLEEVETVVIDARPILDAIDYEGLPAPDADDDNYVAWQAWDAGLLKPWDGPLTVEMYECDEYPAYVEWRETHRTVKGARERFNRLRLDELHRRNDAAKKEFERTKAEIEALRKELKA